MARLLHELEWGEPLIAPVPNTVYEAHLGARLSPWIRAAVRGSLEPERVSYAPLRLMGVAYFIACQENACRYCYGEARALMKISGYSEKQILDLEHEASLASGVTRKVVEFARKLAKSNPSPAREDRDGLLKEGLSPEAVSEIAAIVVKACFFNRMATFLAIPPNRTVENLPNSFGAKVFGFLLRKRMLPRKAPPLEGFRNEGPLAAIIQAAGDTPLASWLRTLTDGWLASPVLPNRGKFLMLAVIARVLGSRLAEEEARLCLGGEGLGAGEIDAILATLSSSILTPLEATLLRWTRETVWYEPRVIQNSTRRLLGELGEEQALEAVGSAAICNTLARLSLVKQ
jgi:alkylhydroperoxidase family enzyme